MKPLLAATLAAVLVSGAALAQSNITAAPPANPTGSNQYQGSGPAVGAAPGGSAAPALGYQGATDEPRPVHRARRHHRRHRAPASTDAMGSSGTNVPTANPGSTK